MSEILQAQYESSQITIRMMEQDYRDLLKKFRELEEENVKLKSEIEEARRYANTTQSENSDLRHSLDVASMDIRRLRKSVGEKERGSEGFGSTGDMDANL